MEDWITFLAVSAVQLFQSRPSQPQLVVPPISADSHVFSGRRFLVRTLALWPGSMERPVVLLIRQNDKLLLISGARRRRSTRSTQIRVPKGAFSEMHCFVSEMRKIRSSGLPAYWLE